MTDEKPASRSVPLLLGLAVVLLEAVVLVVLGIGVVVASLLDQGDMLGTNAGVLTVLILIGGFSFLLFARCGMESGGAGGR